MAVWRSTKGRAAVGWKRAECAVLADAWLEGMPEAVQILLRAKKIEGELVELADSVDPNIKDLKRNMLWLKPTVRLYPVNTPSMFLIADSLMILNEKLGGCAFGAETIGSPAAESKALMLASRIKRLVSKVRRLFRKTMASQDPDIQEMKSWLKKRAAGSGANNGDDDDGAGEAEDVHSSSHEAEEEVAPDSEVDDWTMHPALDGDTGVFDHQDECTQASLDTRPVVERDFMGQPYPDLDGAPPSASGIDVLSSQDVDPHDDRIKSGEIGGTGGDEIFADGVPDGNAPINCWGCFLSTPNPCTDCAAKAGVTVPPSVFQDCCQFLALMLIHAMCTLLTTPAFRTLLSLHSRARWARAWCACLLQSSSTCGTLSSGQRPRPMVIRRVSRLREKPASNGCVVALARRQGNCSC